jgi:azurin
MKLSFTVPTLVATVVLAAGCGQSSSSSPAGAGAAASAAPAAGAREIDITANDTMHYDTTAIQAKPGESLKVVLTNVGASPLAIMGHNWILLKADADAAAFAQAASTAKDTNYIPPALENEILAKIDLLGPRKSGEIDFTAPTTPGDYPYLCTFPAHYLVGMHGILTVK